MLSITWVREWPSSAATRCAEALDESVANCSYLLNTLAKYGYVEQAPGGQGREKPWRMASTEQSWAADGRGENPETAAAGQARVSSSAPAVSASRGSVCVFMRAPWGQQRPARWMPRAAPEPRLEPLARL